MIHCGRCVLAILVALCVLMPCSLSAQDLREKYGTRSAEAARCMQLGLQFSQQKQHAQALAQFKKAYALDPHFDLAFYWAALVHGDMGNLDEAIAIYKKLIERERKKSKVNNIIPDAAVNLALTYARLGKNKEANHWFTEALMLDPEDEHKLHWKALRNMAISLKARKQHLSAALCVVLAYIANQQRVQRGMVKEFLSAETAEEFAQVLHFADEPPTIRPRTAAVKLTSAALPTSIEGQVSDMQLDAKGNRVVVTIKDRPFYYLIESGRGNAARKVGVQGVIAAASLTDGQLFLAIRSPAEIVKTDIGTGKVLSKWPLARGVPQSMAAFPGQRMVSFPLNGLVHTLNLASGQTRNEEYISTALRADPAQRYLFSYIHPGYRETSGHVIIDGRPVFFSTGAHDMAQTSLFKYALARNHVLVASFRSNAASNGRVLHVSPDGNWVTVVGGGGWRPGNRGHGAGYGVGVFEVGDVSKVTGFYKIEAYPQGASINHITQHIAVLNEKGGRVYHLSNPAEHIGISGSFGRASTWSTDGQYLYVAGKDNGVSCWRIERNAAEQNLSRTWFADLTRKYPSFGKAIAASSSEAKPMTELRSFRILQGRSAALAAARKALTQGRTTRPVQWSQHAPFFSTNEEKEFLLGCFNQTKNASTAGVVIYRMKDYLKKKPNHPVGHHLLGMGYYGSNQLDQAEACQIRAIQLDLGRTNATIEALRMLSYLKMRQGKHDQAVYCYAHVLLTDRANPKWLEEFKKFAGRAQMGTSVSSLIANAERQTVKGNGTGGGPSGGAVLRKEPLPKLWTPRGRIRYKPEQLFAKAAKSVVLIRARGSTGSGVCVGKKGIILTNHHVIANARGTIEVIPYAHSFGKMKRLPPGKAEVIFQSPADDVAVLKMARPPTSLSPLYVAAGNPATGTKVYAVGSPGLGNKVLEQSITDGIISATSRELQGKTYIQHTAAVNPGNSGGPLLNEFCQVVGVNTLKARLENVSFAIPATRVRKLFEGK